MNKRYASNKDYTRMMAREEGTSVGDTEGRPYKGLLEGTYAGYREIAEDNSKDSCKIVCWATSAYAYAAVHIHTNTSS